MFFPIDNMVYTGCSYPWKRFMSNLSLMVYSVPDFDAKSMFNPNQCWPYLFKSPRLMRFWFGSIFKVNQDSSEVRTLQPLCCPCAAHTKSCGPVARLEVTIIFIAFQTGVACTRCVCIGPLNCGTVAWSFALSWQKLPKSRHCRMTNVPSTGVVLHITSVASLIHVFEPVL